jgi:hypothetical protein
MTSTISVSVYSTKVEYGITTSQGSNKIGKVESVVEYTQFPLAFFAHWHSKCSHLCLYMYIEICRDTKMAAFWVVAPCSLVEVYQRFRGPCCLPHPGARKMEAARTSGTVVNFYRTTRRCNPEEGHIRTHRRENLKSYLCRDTFELS